MKDIIINKNEDGSNLIALVENGKLIEKYDDDESIKANEGNIYCGIVRDLYQECSRLLLILEKIKMRLYI